MCCTPFSGPILTWVKLGLFLIFMIFVLSFSGLSIYALCCKPLFASCSSGIRTSFVCKLRALIWVDDLRVPVFIYCFFNRLHAPFRCHAFALAPVQAHRWEQQMGGGANWNAMPVQFNSANSFIPQIGNWLDFWMSISSGICLQDNRRWTCMDITDHTDKQKIEQSSF